MLFDFTLLFSNFKVSIHATNDNDETKNKRPSKDREQINDTEDKDGW